MTSILNLGRLRKSVAVAQMMVSLSETYIASQSVS